MPKPKRIVLCNGWIHEDIGHCIGTQHLEIEEIRKLDGTLLYKRQRSTRARRPLKTKRR